MDVGGITPQYETWMNRQEIAGETGHRRSEDTTLETTQEVRTQEVRTQEVRTQEVRTQEVRTQEG